MVVGDERARIPGDMEPGVIVELEAAQVLERQIRGPQHRLGDRLQHEGAQLLDAGIGPAEQVEAALEHLLLGRWLGMGFRYSSVSRARNSASSSALSASQGVRCSCATATANRGLQLEGGSYHGGIHGWSTAHETNTGADQDQGGICTQKCYFVRDRGGKYRHLAGNRSPYAVPGTIRQPGGPLGRIHEHPPGPEFVQPRTPLSWRAGMPGVRPRSTRQPTRCSRGSPGARSRCWPMTVNQAAGLPAQGPELLGGEFADRGCNRSHARQHLLQQLRDRCLLPLRQVVPAAEGGGGSAGMRGSPLRHGARGKHLGKSRVRRARARQGGHTEGYGEERHDLGRSAHPASAAGSARASASSARRDASSRS